jgi:hypothetical protein
MDTGTEITTPRFDRRTSVRYVAAANGYLSMRAQTVRTPAWLLCAAGSNTELARAADVECRQSVGSCVASRDADAIVRAAVPRSSSR